MFYVLVIGVTVMCFDLMVILWLLIDGLLTKNKLQVTASIIVIVYGLFIIDYCLRTGGIL